MQITLRTELKNSDPETIYNIVRDTGFFRPDELDIARDLARETFEKPGEYRFIFAEIEQEITGYICYSEVPGTVGTYDLYWLAVLKKYQRRGIGRYLMRAAEDSIFVLGGRLICLSTSGSDLYMPTRALYETSGYTKAAVISDFYMPGDDQVIYIKKLDN